MPEIRFQVRWPDGSESLCYSPSLVVEEHLAAGTPYALADFLARVDTALNIASERVRAKYGMPCARAMGQLAQINQRAAGFTGDADARITVMGFHR